MPKVRVTMFEDPIEVDDDEVEVLRSQGLLHEEAATAEPALRSAASKPAPKKDGDQS
jgi:hypothetical protein